ncbi:MAG: PorP/SprF family type IX secretion system membrane protein [Saprospiraceae bacterium]
MILIVLAPTWVFSQDIHFSHIHASPTLLNPAMTGLFNGDLRFIANVKSQWQSVTNAYSTFAGSLDGHIYEMGNRDVIGGGLQFYRDKAGDLNFQTTSTSLGLSLLKSLDGKGKHYVSIGVQNAFISSQLDFTKIIAFDNEPAIVEGANNNINYWDVSAGIGWFYTFNKNSSAYLGAALLHINEPLVTFFEKDNVISEGTSLYRKLVLHGGADIKLNRNSTLKPNFIFNDQGPHQEINVGTFWKYSKLGKGMGNRSNTAIYFGAWVRWYKVQQNAGSDAIIAAVRFDHKNTYITFSFDINISSLSQVSYGKGGPELSLIQIIDFNKGGRKSSKVECPEFYY